MGRISRLSCLIVSVAVLVVAGGVARASSVLLNGSFEKSTTYGDGDIVGFTPLPAGYQVLPAGDSTDITDWKVGDGHSLSYYNDFYYNDFPSMYPDGGTRWISFADVGSISQSFAVLAGAPYTVTYYVRERLNTGNSIFASISLPDGGTGTLSQLANTDTQPNPKAWEQFSFTFRSNTDTMATLTFAGGGIYNQSAPTYYGAGVDNASVEQTGPAPEPASLSLLAVGGLLVLRRRR